MRFFAVARNGFVVGSKDESFLKQIKSEKLFRDDFSVDSHYNFNQKTFIFITKINSIQKNVCENFHCLKTQLAFAQMQNLCSINLQSKDAWLSPVRKPQM